MESGACVLAWELGEIHSRKEQKGCRLLCSYLIRENTVEA